MSVTTAAWPPELARTTKPSPQFSLAHDDRGPALYPAIVHVPTQRVRVVSREVVDFEFKCAWQELNLLRFGSEPSQERVRTNPYVTGRIRCGGSRKGQRVRWYPPYPPERSRARSRRGLNARWPLQFSMPDRCQE